MRALGWSLWAAVAVALSGLAAAGVLSVWPGQYWSRADYGSAGGLVLATWVLQGMLCVPFLFLCALRGMRLVTWFAPAVGLAVTLGHYAAFTATPWVGAAAALAGTLYLARWCRVLPLSPLALGAGLLLAWMLATPWVRACAPGVPEDASLLVLVRGACLTLQLAFAALPPLPLGEGRGEGALAKP